MASEPLSDSMFQCYHTDINEALQKHTGFRVGIAFLEDECYSKDWGDRLAIEIFGKPEIIMEVFEYLSKYFVDEIQTKKTEKGFNYSVELYQEFSIDEWAGCAEIRIEYNSTVNLFPVDYSKYLKSNEWRSLRNRLLNERGYKCERCSSKKNLQIHHLTYERLGHEEDNDLIILCQKCHEFVHHS